MKVGFVHGFTQTGRSWQQVVDLLGPTFECVTFDAPGHGTNTNGRRGLVECGDEIASALGGGAVVGYSMGARMALHAVLQHPSAFSRLVLVSGTAGIDDDDERRRRREADDALAARIIDIGVERFVDEWLAGPLFAHLPPDASQRGLRLSNTAQGLADSLRWAGTGTQDPLWRKISDITIPTLVVTGEADTKFDALGERLARMIPGAVHVSVAGAGHSVHMERPAEFVSILRSFLEPPRTQSPS